MLEQEEKKETRKCFKCDKEGHIAKDCKGKHSMKKWKIQEESDDKEDNKEEKKKQGFGEDSSRHGMRDLPCKFSEQIYYS